MLELSAEPVETLFMSLKHSLLAVTSPLNLSASWCVSSSPVWVNICYARMEMLKVGA